MLAESYLANTHTSSLARSSTYGFQTPGLYKGLRMDIDLTTAQGRWELVVLGLLLAARVSEPVAETTFFLLREGGLLEFERVLRQELPDVARVQEIMATEYRAMINRGHKVAAIFTNARWLAERYQGDLHEVYTRHFKRPDPVERGGKAAKRKQLESPAGELLGVLRQLQQINTRARWICRVMVEAEIWTDLPVEATIYFDRHVRCALTKLGLIKEPITDPSARQEIETVVGTQFAGDTTSLYRLGRFLCLSADPHLCRSTCQLFTMCQYWQKIYACSNMQVSAAFLHTNADECDDEVL